MSEPRRYSLDEARRELARRECAMLGHDWAIVERLGGWPGSVICERCAESHHVVPPTVERLVVRSAELDEPLVYDVAELDWQGVALVVTITPTTQT